MIILYSGTPGSGKSLHCARTIYYALKRGEPVIANFAIDEKQVGKHKGSFIYKSNEELTPDYLVSYSLEYCSGRRVKEGGLLLVIDEAQLMFNSRDYSRKDRSDWLTFFSQHRHLNYDIILIAQFDRMLDRQIRSLIEYETIHRKVSNFGWKGKLLSLAAFGNLFVSVKVWYPMRLRTDSEFFRASKKYYSLYDTHALFERTNDRLRGDGGPAEGSG